MSEREREKYVCMYVFLRKPGPKYPRPGDKTYCSKKAGVRGGLRSNKEPSPSLKKIVAPIV